MIHTCDVKEREAVNKTCESPETIDEYFKMNIVGLDLTSEKPGLLNFDKDRPLYKNKRDLRYTVKP